MWSNWRGLNDKNLNENWTQSPGVYLVRLVNKKGLPIKINRILAADKGGLLYIGMAAEGRDGGLCNRLWGFWTAVQGTDENYHAAGRKFRRLLAKHFPNCHLQYRHRKIKSGRSAKDFEAQIQFLSATQVL